MSIHLTIGDITLAEADAIVNAANEIMLGGGGVDGAIHRAAGPALIQACREVPEVNGIRCPTGEARITAAGELSARYVIHTVGPRYQHHPNAAQLLASAYRRSFQLALKHRCRSLAVPAVSCGVFGYPLAEAAEIAFSAAAGEEFAPLEITFYLSSRHIFDTWEQVLHRHSG